MCCLVQMAAETAAKVLGPTALSLAASGGHGSTGYSKPGVSLFVR